MGNPFSIELQDRRAENPAGHDNGLGRGVGMASGERETNRLDYSPPSELFIQALTEHQPQLQGYIIAALGDPSSVSDILQRTNLTLWKKANQFNDEEPFLPWAIAFARYEILSYWRDRTRSRLTFDTDVVELMCSTAEGVIGEVPERVEALSHCLDKVPSDARSLLTMRYGGDMPINEIANRTGRSIDSIKSVLKRVRRSLANYIARELAQKSAQG